MLNRVKNYIMDQEFRLTLYANAVHIINYQKIISLESERIVISCTNKKIVILGQNLHLSKLLDLEILIEGDFKNYRKKSQIIFR